MEYREYSRGSLLKLVDSSASEEDFDAVDARRGASAKSLELTAEWAAYPALSSADLRKVDPQQDSYRKPVLVLRRGCLVASLPPIRALIFTRRVLLFLEPGADGDIEPIVSRMRSWSQGRDDEGVSTLDPFVHAAFAAILGGTLATLQSRLSHLAQDVARCTATAGRSLSSEVQFEYLQNAESIANETTGLLEGVAHCVVTASEAANEAADARAAAAEAAAAAVAAAAARRSAAAAASSARAAAGSTAAAGAGAAANARAPSALPASPPSSAPRAKLLRRSNSLIGLAEPLTNSLLGLMDASEDHLDEFAAEVGDLLVQIRNLHQKLSLERKRITVQLAKQRNNILRIGLMLQLTMGVIGCCSMVSGYFGMNLDNGGCGPDGCHDILAADHGHQRFNYVASTTSVAAVLLGVSSYLVIRRHI